jgi:hypothetical protein
MADKNRGIVGSFLKNMYYDPFKWYALLYWRNCIDMAGI